MIRMSAFTLCITLMSDRITFIVRLEPWTRATASFPGQAQPGRLMPQAEHGGFQFSGISVVRHPPIHRGPFQTLRQPVSRIHQEAMAPNSATAASSSRPAR